MIRSLFAIFVLLNTATSPANGGERLALGGVGIFTNDYLGDQGDRWRTGSLTRSEFFGDQWQGALPQSGVITEFRLRTEMIAPTRVHRAPEPNERPYVGLIAPGAFAHFSRGDWDYRLGGELVVVGPQTKVADFMDYAHDRLGFKDPVGTSFQIADAVYPSAEAEISRGFALDVAGASVRTRPFVNALAGAETGLRAGVDILIGGQDRLFAREPVTGHMVGAARTETGGPVVTMGLDAFRVFDSQFLPGGLGYEMEPWRIRARAGIDMQVAGWDLFYGLTYLGPEYSTQTEGQIVGSVAMFMRF